MSFICMIIKNNFHQNHFTLKQKLGATRKLPINLVHLYSELLLIKAFVVIHGFSVNYVFFYLLKQCYVCRLENRSGLFCHNRFCKDAKERREIFAKSARASHPLTPSLTPRFHPLVPVFSFNRSRAHLNLGKNTSCFCSLIRMWPLIEYNRECKMKPRSCCFVHFNIYFTGLVNCC